MATLEPILKEYLRENGRSKVSEIADNIDYSTGWIRQKAKELAADDGENVVGTKGKQVPAAIIDDNYEVLSGDRDYLLGLVKKYAPHLLPRAKSMNVRELQRLIRNQIADDIVGGPKPWVFWVEE